MNSSEDKHINSTCKKCKCALQWKRREVIMLNPCEHLIHRYCYNRQKEKNKCILCDNNVSSITRLSDIYKDSNNYQKCIDILSITNFDRNVKTKPMKVFKNSFDFISLLIKMVFTRGFDDSRKLCSQALSLGNLNLKTFGLEKIKNEPKVFISTHTCYLDFVIIFYLLKTGFLSTSTVKDNAFAKQVSKIIPLLTVEIGTKSNTVEKIKEYVEKYGSICLFPEGMITHPFTIGKFRTGAFNVGHPVYPIVIKYKNKISDTKILDMMFKFTSEVGGDIEFYILDPYYPPFDDVKIEEIRKDMANVGNMLLSRVSNRDVNNSKKK